MAVDPMEEVAKRMQGLKDSRGPVGELARGKNMYPAGNNAQSGPGGPDMGRPPTAVSPQAVQAVMAQTGGAPPPQATPSMPQALQGLQQSITPQAPSPGLQQASAAMQNKSAQMAFQAAAQRKLQRGR
jgi:hypothetical protein